MKFIVYSTYSDDDISSKLGVPEYSYYFVLQKFLPLLHQLGDVVFVKKPLQEVDEIYFLAREENEDCLYLSFTAPQNVATDLQCPTVCVFAWEFDSIPTELFDTDENSNWQHVFSKIEGIITHSTFTANLLRHTLSPDYEIAALPAPVWDHFHLLNIDQTPLTASQETILRLDCPTIDTHKIDLQLVEKTLYPQVGNEPSNDIAPANVTPITALIKFARALYRDSLAGLLSNPSGSPATATLPIPYFEAVSTNISDRNPKVDPLIPVLSQYSSSGELELTLSGVIYTTVLNPNDGRKNWHDMVCGFCIALKDKVNATLVIKLIQRDSANMLLDLIHRLYQLTPFKCRVVIIDGYLEEEAYTRLFNASHYVVNTSHGEGQCLPLMEFMSAGKPAIAPVNTALEDYISSDVAFIIESHREAALFPHDPRACYRTHRYRLNWQSLRIAFERSFETITENPDHYAQMAAAASSRMQKHCSSATIKNKLEEFVNSGAIQAAINRPAPKQALEENSRHSQTRDLLQHVDSLGETDGWFNAHTRDLFIGFGVNEDDIVADLGCGMQEASEFCANQGIRTRFFSDDRSRLTRIVSNLQQTQAPQFRAYLSAIENHLPQQDESVNKILILNVLQDKEDPLAFLKEALRIGRPGSVFLIAVPDANSLRKSPLGIAMSKTLKLRHEFSAADIKHLVTESSLQIEHESSAKLYWLLRSFLFENKRPNVRAESVKNIHRLLLDLGIEPDGEGLAQLQSPAAHVILARKPG